MSKKQLIEETPMSFDGVLAEATKRFGKGVIAKASEAKGLEVRHFSTGSISLDLALGGGWAEGRMSEILGAYSSCKTTLAIFAAKEYLKLHPEAYVVYLDLEQAFDVEWLKFLGGDPMKFVLARPAGGEEAGDILVDWMNRARESEQHVFFVVDSIAAALPTKYVESDMEDQHVGIHAKLINKLIAKALVAMRHNLLNPSPFFTLMFLNQFRNRIVLFGDPDIGTGGRGRDFYESQQIRLRRDSFLKRKSDKDSSIQEVMGLRIKFKIDKCKTGGIQGTEGAFSFFLRDDGDNKAGTIENAEESIPYAVFHGIVEERGNKVLWQNEELSKKQLAAKLRSNPKELAQLRQLLLKKTTGKEI